MKRSARRTSSRKQRELNVRNLVSLTPSTTCKNQTTNNFFINRLSLDPKVEVLMESDVLRLLAEGDRTGATQLARRVLDVGVHA